MFILFLCLSVLLDGDGHIKLTGKRCEAIVLLSLFSEEDTGQYCRLSVLAELMCCWFYLQILV